MSSTTYKLVFDGKITAGQNAQSVKRNLISLFKSDTGQIERLFSSPSFVIKRGINHSTALKYQQALEKAGALCRILPDNDAGETASLTMAGEVMVSKAAEQNRMICPMCNYEQDTADECIQCGTVIRKYFEKANRHPPPMSMPVSAPTKTRPAKSRLKALWLAPALIILGLLYLILTREQSGPPLTHGPGILAPNAPEQEMISSGDPFSYKDYQITTLATFQLEARVLSTKRYRSGRESDLSPVDLALGWGPMSDEAVLEEINIRQSNRFYYWKVEQFPISRKEIEQNSANMHIIPANQEIEKTLKNIRKGHLVEIEGYLVKVDAKDGWRWKSSLTRNDTGNGACELVWVEEIQIK